MEKRFKFIAALLLVIEFFVLGLWLTNGIDIPVLNPKGLIARGERDLLFTATFIMLLIIVPVFVSIFAVAYKFRAGNKKARYDPNTKSKGGIELLWWFAPIIIVAALGIVTWKGTHALDPYRPIDSTVRPVKIQVVALQWKWLFLYPEHNIATVNFIQFPKDTPVNFELTSDAPMNSFWIPSLAGQIYAMTGMSTRLHVQADETGDYPGYAAEISGKGFSRMKFVARASTNSEFDEWVSNTKQSPGTLDWESYEKLAEPSEDDPVRFYSSYEKNLYNRILMKYMSSDNDMKSHGK